MHASLRVAVPDDAPAIHELICALAEYEREPDAVETSPSDLRRQLQSATPPFECLLAEREGRAIGFALYFATYSTWRGRPGIWLEDLFVREEHRGHGVGRALLQEVARRGVARGCARLELTALDWNEPARGFYRRLGAVPLEGWTTWRFTGPALDSLADPAAP